MTTLLIATRNRHKTGEIQAILGPAFRFLTLNDFPAAPAVVEDAATFAGNATKKAVELARWLVANQPAIPAGARPVYVLADDSGLEVDALNGAPGVHSARFAALEGSKSAGDAGNSPDAENNGKLLRLLAGVPAAGRTARFRCVIALAPVPPVGGPNVPPMSGPADTAVRIFEGSCAGQIQLTPSGAGGFGYDPLFVPDGFAQSFAELGEEVKNRLSHRAQALAGLRTFFGGQRKGSQ
jgi:XTP/dITP diphosphohydrolase